MGCGHHVCPDLGRVPVSRRRGRRLESPGHRLGREAGIRPSMGSVGDAYDNALCESLFATFVCELLDHQRFRLPMTHSYRTFVRSGVSPKPGAGSRGTRICPVGDRGRIDRGRPVALDRAMPSGRDRGSGHGWARSSAPGSMSERSDDWPVKVRSRVKEIGVKGLKILVPLQGAPAESRARRTGDRETEVLHA
jgi:hypothetical protein